MTDRLMGSLGLCRRAGRLVWGADAVGRAIAAGQAHLVVLAADLSEKSGRKAAEAAQAAGVPVRRLPATMEQLEQLLGRCTGILAVTGPDLAKLVAGSIGDDKEVMQI